MKPMIGIFTGVVFLLATAVLQESHAQESPHSGADGITIDGSFDEAIWNDAIPVADFESTEPTISADPVRTSVRIVVDADAMYIAAAMTDSHPGPSGHSIASLVASDWLLAIFEDDPDGKALVFGISRTGDTRGIRVDGSDESEFTSDGWEAATRATEDGWSAELRIPLGAIALGDGPGQQLLGMSFERRLGRGSAGESMDQEGPFAVATAPPSHLQY